MIVLGSQTIAILTPALVEDAYHNEVEDWSSPTALAIGGCSVQPGGGDDFVLQREAITTLFTVWAPPQLQPIPGTCRVLYAGVTYDIDGPVERWEVGTALDHVVIRLKETTG